VAVFLTGLLLLDHPKHSGLFPLRGRGFTLELRAGTQEGVFSSYSSADGEEVSGPAPEVAIRAKGEQQAERALALIAAALTVVEASNFVGIETSLTDERAMQKLDGRERTNTMAMSGIAEACALAARASWRRSRAYAVARLHFSKVFFSTHYMDRHPSYSDPMPKTEDPLMHVRFAEAIVLAHGAIEELGLQIKASNEKPSTKNGQWNPPVLVDLERRLRAAGLDPYAQVLWEIRGRKTLLETVRGAKAQRRAPWTRWPDVRDVDVALVDAIAHVSWLRSKVSAHAAPHRLRHVLSPYDVANAQHIARELILGSRWAGIFRLWFGRARSSP
jgi:hypothetical protein